ncbi:DNA repair protein RecN [Larsenimonas rhizosphaerae]|uniref:DNA repair protein RecN n=1 Tax=Larsenimonas rhizosphaerae TaxID=2944682 RepID=UPI00203482FD|nr:DNA repair protein RecN [Larsenimonas rhizosphaerae]MCM2131491.1 DNA repair protein RecN [Larsenimonas rhizosphaerae]
MLSQLSIRHYAIVEHLELEFHQGMTAITGETGAGKSILLGALSLCLGERADAGSIRHGAAQADISARFDIRELPAAAAWLAERNLDTEDCLLRRVVTASGRSKAWINGSASTAADLKALSELLIEVHGQHAHHSLLREETHLHLVDELADHQAEVTELRQMYRQWQALRRDIRHRRDNGAERDARSQLLRYQVDELDQLALADGELAQLESEQTELAHADQLLQTAQSAIDDCAMEDRGALSRLASAVQQLGSLPTEQQQRFKSALAMMEDARIQLEEAVSELSWHHAHIDLDPSRLQLVEERLGSVHGIARKHYIAPEELVALHQRLADELEQLEGGDDTIAALEEQAEALRHQWRELAGSISARRMESARIMAERVQEQLRFLGMEKARFTVEVVPRETPQPEGLDQIQFMMSANPGQPSRPLHKVASGGELSRISLAIQVVTAQLSPTSTLVFDEVDVGISGATAEIVGQLLQQLGHGGQVLCVTHLPQVAAQAHQHLHIEKQTGDSDTRTSMLILDHKGRVKELARMLGGIHLSPQTLAHAREMLKSGQSRQRH